MKYNVTAGTGKFLEDKNPHPPKESTKKKEFISQLTNIERLADAMMLGEPMPPESIKKNLHNKLSTINAAYIIERLNIVFGVGHWDIKHTIIKDEANFVLMKGRIFIRSMKFSTPFQYGSGLKTKDADPADAYKSAVTDIMSKCSSYLGIGLEVFKGEHNLPLPKNDKPDKITGVINEVVDKMAGATEDKKHNSDWDENWIVYSVEELTTMKTSQKIYDILQERNIKIPEDGKRNTNKKFRDLILFHQILKGKDVPEVKPINLIKDDKISEEKESSQAEGISEIKIHKGEWHKYGPKETEELEKQFLEEPEARAIFEKNTQNAEKSSEAEGTDASPKPIDIKDFKSKLMNVPPLVNEFGREFVGEKKLQSLLNEYGITEEKAMESLVKTGLIYEFKNKEELCRRADKDELIQFISYFK